MKLFKSIYAGFKEKFNGSDVHSEQMVVTGSETRGGRFGLDTAPSWLALVSNSGTLDAVVGGKRILPITGHSFLPHDVIRFVSGANIHIEAKIEAVTANEVLLATELPNVSGASDQYYHLRPMTPTLDLNGNVAVTQGSTTVVDFLDAGSMVPTGANAIPASSSNPLQVVASLAKPCTKIQVVSDVGEFINIYTDALGANLIAHMVLTPDEIVDVDIPLGASVYLRAAKNAVIDDPNSIISMNFIG